MNEPNSSVGSDVDDALDRLEEKMSQEEPVKTSGGNILSVLAFLLSLIAVCGAAYSLFITFGERQTEQNRNESLLTLQQPLRQAQQSVIEMQQTVSLLQSSSAAESTRLEMRLNEIVREVQSIEGTSSRDWLLAEVEYLLKLANQRILVEKEVATAITLLQSADEILEQSAGISAYTLREAIANDIARLKAVGMLDQNGLFLRLGALVNQVSLLQQKQKSFQASNDANVSDPTNDLIDDPSTLLGKASQFLNKLVQRLTGLVDFRRGVERVQPILPPAEEYYLRQNLILKLEQAQIALLKGNQAVFEYSLKDSLKWIELYFDARDPVTQAMSEAILELLQVRVTNTLPDISSSLQLVRQLLTDFHKAPEKAVKRDDIPGLDQ